jgi:hypothetical protein
MERSGWATAHGEPTPGEYAFMRLTRQEFLGLFILSGMDQNAFIASIFRKYLKAWSFLISSVARGSLLATGFKQWFINASMVTR